MMASKRLKEIGEAAAFCTQVGRAMIVAVDFRLWVRDQCDAADGALAALMESLIGRGRRRRLGHARFTQSVAQPRRAITMAYAEMSVRDRARFADARKRMNESSLGRQHWLARLSR
jgi:argininosuccinate lyase